VMSSGDTLSGAWLWQGPSGRNPPGLLPCYLRDGVEVFVVVDHRCAMLFGARSDDEVGKRNSVLAACCQEGLNVQGSIERALTHRA
jgi:hypothetical protein